MNTENKKSKVESPKDVLSIKEAARVDGVTKQSIHMAIKKKRLKSTKDPKSGRRKINRQDLEEYRLKKYSRDLSTFNGELLFDNSKGFYSIGQTAKMLDVDYQKIYHAMRMGLLNADRRGCAWVLHIDAIEDYKKTLKLKVTKN